MTQPHCSADSAIAALAKRFWTVHPKEIQDLGVTREQFYEREMRALFAALSGQPQTARETIIEECASIADDHTPAKHQGTLAAHVTGRTIAKAIRALSLSRPQRKGDQ
jgi:hypothetical protein